MCREPEDFSTSSPADFLATFQKIFHEISRNNFAESFHVRPSLRLEFLA
jgi:hypothetical protein